MSEYGDLDDDYRDLPVIVWTKEFSFPAPRGYRPEYIDVGDGVVVDENRLPWLLDWLLTMHPESERIRQVAATHPGLEVKDEPESTMIWAKLSFTGELVGKFDRRLLLA